MSSSVFSVFVETRVNCNIVKLQVHGPRTAYIFLPCTDFCLEFEEAEEEDAVDLRRLLVRGRFRVPEVFRQADGSLDGLQCRFAPDGAGDGRRELRLDRHEG